MMGLKQEIKRRQSVAAGAFLTMNSSSSPNVTQFRPPTSHPPAPAVTGGSSSVSCSDQSQVRIQFRGLDTVLYILWLVDYRLIVDIL